MLSVAMERQRVIVVVVITIRGPVGKDGQEIWGVATGLHDARKRVAALDRSGAQAGEGEELDAYWLQGHVNGDAAPSPILVVLTGFHTTYLVSPPLPFGLVMTTGPWGRLECAYTKTE